jgi:peptidoglycan/xylan/chitin deacetylase (PgdA/CDA1 family)
MRTSMNKQRSGLHPFPRSTVRSLVRVLGVPVAVAVIWALRLSSRKAGIVLMYHSVAEQGGEPASELVPPHAASLFARQVGHLASHYNVVDAARLRDEAARRPRFSRFPAAITFDDDYECHATVSLPLLRAAGTTATFFLSGASLERPFAFWYERLQRAYDLKVPGLAALVMGEDAPAGPVGIHELGLHVERMNPDERDAVARRIAEIVGPDPSSAGIRAEQVRQLSDEGMTIGFHTLRHDSLAWLPDDLLAVAMTDGREALEAAAGGPIATIGYPHGRADERVAAVARRAGFRAGFTTRSVAVTPASDPLLQGRLGPSLRSVGSMACLLAWALLRAGSAQSREAP